MNKLTKFSRAIVAIAMMLAVGFPSFAHDFEVDGIYYEITDETSKTVEVTYRGSSYYSYNQEYGGSVVIPDSVSYKGTTYSVTSIKGYAFNGCSGLTSVTIGNSVTSIGAWAFEGCSGLTGDLVIPNSVTSIGGYAFYDCSGLTGDLVIPNSVTSIGDWAFSGCSGLTGDLVIPNSVTSIGIGAFRGCTSLTSVTIGNSVMSIGSSAFYGCSGLNSVTIGNSVMSIGNSAFYGIYEIKNVFYNAMNCNSTKDVSLSCDNNFIISKEVTNIPDNLNSSGQLGNVMISLPTTPPSCGPNSFTSTTKTNTTLYVPKGSYAAYWTASVWQDFKNIKEIGQVATAISLPESMELTLNNSVKLEATLTPTNTTITTLYWKTSNLDVATVDQEGNVTAVANGKATITAITIDGSEFSASCEVKIGVQDVESISISQKSAELKPNEMLNLTCSVIPENATNKAITWASDNTSIAVVRTNSDGSATVLAVAPGIANITTTTNDGTNLSDTCVVKVLKLAESITLNKTTAAINTGETIDLTAIVLPDNTSNKAVTWTSSDESHATVIDNGDGTAIITAVNTGVVTITATTADGSNLSASCEITVSPILTLKFPEYGVIKHNEDYNEAVNLSIKSNEDWKINTVTFNEEDITYQLDEEGNYTTPVLTENATLIVVFEKISTDIETISPQNNIKVYANNGEIKIIGADSMSEVVIYNTMGTTVYNGVEKNINLDQTGVYILSVEGRIFKFAL